MSHFTAWLHADMGEEDAQSGVAVCLAATDRNGALREAQRLLVARRGLGQSSGFRIFDDLDGRLVHEGCLVAC